DDAGPGDQEKRPIESDLVAAELHRRLRLRRFDIAPSSLRDQLGNRMRRPALRATLLVERSANEADEQRMTATRVRREFRMELAAEEPGMLRQLDHFAQVAGDVALRPCADGEARGLQPRQIMIVDFVAVPVTFG